MKRPHHVLQGKDLLVRKIQAFPCRVPSPRVSGLDSSTQHSVACGVGHCSHFADAFHSLELFTMTEARISGISLSGQTKKKGENIF